MQLVTMQLLLCMICTTMTAAESGGSKLSGSRLSGGATIGADGTVAPVMPFVRSNGELVEDVMRPIENTLNVDGRTIALRPLHDELQLTYVHGLLSDDEVDDLVRLATLRDGFARSPLKQQGTGSDATGGAQRNSSSCPMLWPLVYASRIEEVKKVGGERAERLIEELSLVSRLTSRVAELFTQTGMELTEQHIEPLQLVRYVATEVFTPHHDYHEPDAQGHFPSSVQGEQRVFTVLFFGATLPADAGGETHFPELDIAVSPRKGDALIWANVDGEGEPNPRSLHEGRPPADGYTKVAVNCWIANKQFELGQGMDRAVRGKGSGGDA